MENLVVMSELELMVGHFSVSIHRHVRTKSKRVGTVTIGSVRAITATKLEKEGLS